MNDFWQLHHFHTSGQQFKLFTVGLVETWQTVVVVQARSSRPPRKPHGLSLPMGGCTSGAKILIRKPFLCHQAPNLKYSMSLRMLS